MKASLFLPSMALLTTMVTIPAWAEWAEVAKAGSATYYVDQSTLRFDRTKRRIWVLSDLNEPDKAGALSKREHFEIDCWNESFQVTYISLHLGHMAEGAPLQVTSENKWWPIPPATAADYVRNVVCAQQP